MQHVTSPTTCVLSNTLLILAIVAALPRTSLAAGSGCELMCNGHGTCNKDSRCDCFAGWDGELDCSLRSCPYGHAWAGYVNPVATVTATGPTGDGASTTGSGATATVQTTADGNITGVTIDVQGGSYHNASIAITDAVQVDRKIRLTLSASEDLAGTGSVRLRLGGFWGDLVLGADSAACEAAWESLANIADVTCTHSDPEGDNNAQYDVEFHAFTEWPVYYNNVHLHDGNPPLDAFACDVEHFAAAGASCAFTDLNAAEGTSGIVKEWAVCSNRGICDHGTGMCKCFDGMGGPGKSRACSQVGNQLTMTCGGTEISPGHSPATHDSKASQLELNAYCLGYTGSVLDVDSRRGSSSRFNLVDIYEDMLEIYSEGYMKDATQLGQPDPVWSVRGDGKLTLYGGVHVHDPCGDEDASLRKLNNYDCDARALTNANTGAKVVAGGATVAAGGVHAKGGIEVEAGGVNVTSTGRINATSVTMEDFTLEGLFVDPATGLMRQDKSAERYRWDPGLLIKAGGLRVSESGMWVHLETHWHPVMQVLVSNVDTTLDLNGYVGVAVKVVSTKDTSDRFALFGAEAVTTTGARLGLGETSTDPDKHPNRAFELRGDGLAKIGYGGLLIDGVGEAAAMPTAAPTVWTEWTPSSVGLDIIAGGLKVTGNSSTPYEFFETDQIIGQGRGQDVFKHSRSFPYSARFDNTANNYSMQAYSRFGWDAEADAADLYQGTVLKLVGGGIPSYQSGSSFDNYHYLLAKAGKSPTLKASGVMTAATATFFVEIVDETATPPTFRWKKGSSGSFVTGDVSTDAIALSDGVSIEFTGDSDFNSNNAWEFTVPQGGDSHNAPITPTATEYTRFSIKGSGQTTVHNAGLLVEAGGGKVDSGGVTVDADGAVVRAGGMFVLGGGVTARAAGAWSDKGALNTHTRANVVDVATLASSHASYAGTLLRLQTARAASGSFKIATATSHEYQRQNRGIAVAGTNTGDNTNITVRVEKGGRFPHQWRFKKDADEEFSEEPIDAGLEAAEIVEGEGVTIQWDAVTGYTDGATFVIPVFKDLAVDTAWVSKVNNVSTPAVQWGIDGTGLISVSSAALNVGGAQVAGTQQAAVADVSGTNDPGDGTIAGLSFSTDVTQAEVNALRTNCEKLRDFASDVRTTANALLATLRGQGLIAT